MPVFTVKKTAQAPDKLLFRGGEWTLIGPYYGPFNPKEHGVKPVARSSANWRGYITTFRLRGNRLEVEDVVVGLSERDREQAARGRGPLLLGKPPTLVRRNARESEWVYRDLGYAPDFSGTLAIGTDYRPEYRPLFGIDRAGYRLLYELTFAKGVLRSSLQSPVCVAVDEETLRCPIIVSEQTMLWPSVRAGKSKDPKQFPELTGAFPPSLSFSLRAPRKELTLRLAIGADGATAARVVTPSGNADADRRVRDAFNRWTWEPAVSFRTNKPAPCELKVRFFLE